MPAVIVHRIGGRIRRAIVTVPSRRDLLELAVATAVFAAAATPLGLATGLFMFRPAAPIEVAQAALIALVFPALGEEVVFRAAMVPDRRETPNATLAIILSTTLFVFWHVVESRTFLAVNRGLFDRPEFLACAGALGLACAVLRRRSGSIWPAVILHWAAVIAWKAWLGGPELRI